MRETKHTTYEVRVEAGTYFLGDPCYAVPESLWMPLLESCNYYQDSPVGTVKKNGQTYEVLAFGTAYGDGVYQDNQGHSYPVDAGLIGLTPIELVEGIPRPDLGRVVTFERNFICVGEEGMMHFGSRIQINNDYESDN